MNCRYERRNFLKQVGLGTLGLGFGVSIFAGIFQRAQGATEPQRHDLNMKGTVNFKGFVAQEVTPNDMFYITSYSSSVREMDEKQFRLRIEGHGGVKRTFEPTFQGNPVADPPAICNWILKK
jgi:hypothetical protein